MPTNIDGPARRTLPTLVADGAKADLRLDSYGSVHSRSELLAFAEEGTYFRACNPTMGTGIAMGTQTGPVVLSGANHCMLVHMWNPANATTAPSWEFELVWWER